MHTKGNSNLFQISFGGNMRDHVFTFVDITNVVHMPIYISMAVRNGKMLFLCCRQAADAGRKGDLITCDLSGNNNPFLLGVLHYMPYAVLGTMTVPAIFTSTGEPISAVAGFVAALLLGLKRRSLIEVALAATVAAYVTSLILPLL